MTPEDQFTTTGGEPAAVQTTEDGKSVVACSSSSPARRTPVQRHQWHDLGGQPIVGVVVATGPYQRPRLPDVQRDLPARLPQLHASEYRNPAALPKGAVLVVGSGASGCQIADELQESGRRVFLSVGHHRRLPRRYRGRDVFWWRRELGEWDQTVDTTPPERRRTSPLVTGVHGGYDVDLRQSSARGVGLLGRIAGAADGRIAFAPDLECLLQEGDAAYREFIAASDALAPEREGLAAPEPARERLAPALTGLKTLDIEAEGIAAVIWATGYEVDFGWIEFPIFDGRGRLLQYRGASSVPGLYFLGLHFMHKLKSSLVSGVGEDAAHIAGLITGREC